MYCNKLYMYYYKKKTQIKFAYIYVIISMIDINHCRLFGKFHDTLYYSNLLGILNSKPSIYLFRPFKIKFSYSSKFCDLYAPAE